MYRTLYAFQNQECLNTSLQKAVLLQSFLAPVCCVNWTQTAQCSTARYEYIVSCRAVAASDVNKYGWTPALQDNVEIWLFSLKAAYPWTEILWASEWINIKHKLVSLIALAFSVIWDQVCTCIAHDPKRVAAVGGRVFICKHGSYCI